MSCLTNARDLFVGHVAGIALGRNRQVDHRLRQRQIAFRRTQPLVGGGGIVGDLHRARVGQADVFPRHAHDAARQVARIDAAVEHPAQPVQRRIRIGAAHRLVQRGNLVVERIAALVEPAQRVAQAFDQQRRIDFGQALGARGPRDDFQIIQQLAAVAVGAGDQRRPGFRS